MTVAERVRGAQLLVTLASGCNSLRSHLDDLADRRKELTREQLDIRAKIKRLLAPALQSLLASS